VRDSVVITDSGEWRLVVSSSVRRETWYRSRRRRQLWAERRQLTRRLTVHQNDLVLAIDLYTGKHCCCRTIRYDSGV